MPGRPSRAAFLVLSGVLFALLALTALTQAGALLALGLLLTIAILWLEGHVRFPRLRRFFRSIGAGLWQLARTRRMSKKALRNLGIVLGVVLVIILLNQLHLAAPGEGRGLSVPTGALSLNFGGINSPGEWVATSMAYAFIATLLGLGWYRLRQQAVLAGGTWRRRAYWSCLAAFFALPFLFALAMATLAPEDPKHNVEYSKMLLRAVGVGMAFAFSAAVALPFVGDEAPRTTSAAPISAPAYIPSTPPTRTR